MKNSSNTDMNAIFEQLSNIKMAMPNEYLYAQTFNKIQKKNTIPLFWARAAACILFAIICSELYFAVNKKPATDKDIAILIYKPNNVLYHE